MDDLRPNWPGCRAVIPPPETAITSTGSPNRSPHAAACHPASWAMVISAGGHTGRLTWCTVRRKPLASATAAEAVDRGTRTERSAPQARQDHQRRPLTRGQGRQAVVQPLTILLVYYFDC